MATVMRLTVEEADMENPRLVWTRENMMNALRGNIVQTLMAKSISNRVLYAWATKSI